MLHQFRLPGVVIVSLWVLAMSGCARKSTPDITGTAGAAEPTAQVFAGEARFTVLTSRMIRMEWSP
ncbi:hypothetical protein HZA57_02130, partial [Candidatus Poribacteria bacterium]|nr:hypothetical protein [Candidatus Poribacteria bacterium]